MRACCCSLAGTRHCDHCSNGPSRMATSIPVPFDRPSAIEIEKLIVNINTEDDPKKVKNAIIKAFEELQKEDVVIPKNATWSTTSL